MTSFIESTTNNDIVNYRREVEVEAIYMEDEK
jgi:hypothetical protein